jgi:ElaB/YqjD/DUF883 family membrane-anchored ribosome-binding protein
MQNPIDTNGKSGSTAQQAEEAARRNIQETQRSAHDAIDTATGKVHPAVDQVASKVHEATDNLAGAASQAADRLGRRGEEFMESQAELLESIRDYTHQKPMTALGIAVGAGFILSMLLRKG